MLACSQVLAYALGAIHETQDNIMNAENATESEKAQVRVSPQDLRSVFAELVDEHCVERAPEADLDPPEPFTYRSARRGKGKLAQAEAQADAVRALARVRPVWGAWGCGGAGQLCVACLSCSVSLGPGWVSRPTSTPDPAQIAQEAGCPVATGAALCPRLQVES